MTQEILQRLDALAAKLGVAAGELWRVLLAHARIDAIENAFWIVCASGLLWAACLLICRGLDEDYDPVPWNLSGASVGIVGVLILGFSLHGFLTAIDPSYWALQQIVGK